jgi:hypothetical protein
LLPYEELAKALYERLNGTVNADVYDYVPPGIGYPYVTVGDFSSADDSTKTSSGQGVTYFVHVYSDYHGVKEVADLMGEVMTALEKEPLSLTSFQTLHVSGFETEVSREFDEDKEIRHGIVSCAVIFYQSH